MPRELPDIVSDLQSRHGQIEKDGHYFGYLYAKEEAEEIRFTISDYVRVSWFQPIGTFCCGDVICILENGSLFVYLHDERQIIRSGMKLEEFAERLATFDRGLEEEVYIRED